jgi:tetratricopeptide (TPR) repeat protein
MSDCSSVNMAEAKEIKALLKEAQLYQSQGLLKEAKKRYENALEMVEGNNDLSISEKEKILVGVLSQIQSLDEVTYRVEKKTNISEISPRDRDLIKRLFSSTATNDNDNALLDGAVALAKFGQFDRAISEFEDLLEDSPLRIVAAKHILRCHMAMRTLHDPILQFQKWSTTGYFQKEELSELSTFLERTYGLSVTEPEAPPQARVVPQPPPTAPPPTDPAPKKTAPPPEEDSFDPYEDEYVDVLGSINGNSGQPDGESTTEDTGDYVDIIGGEKKQPTTTYDDFAGDALDDYVDYISSVGIPLASGETATIPVNLQTGSVANLIISGDQKLVIEKMKKGARIENAELNSPISTNTGNCTVVAVARIDMGPKKGHYSVDLKIEG